MVEAELLRSISLVVPALNERVMIERTVLEVLEVTKMRFSEFEIILVDDGSTDGTGEIMDGIASRHDNIRVLHNEHNIGLGASYARGVATATKQYVMMLCGDGGLPASSLPDIFDCIGRADIVVPYMTNLKRIKTPLRYFLSRSYTLCMNVLFGQHLHYYNGLPIHRLDLLRQITVTSSGFGFQGEILIKLLKAGCSYVEVGVLGGELKQSSSALRVRNLISVFATVGRLAWELIRFKPSNLCIPPDPQRRSQNR